MADSYRIYWDGGGAVLHIHHLRGLWTGAIFDSYEAELLAVLGTAPVRGFDLLLDQSEATPQSLEISNRRNETLNHLIRHGMKRAVIVAPSAVTAMQTDRIVRQSGADMHSFVTCKTRDEALALLR